MRKFLNTFTRKFLHTIMRMFLYTLASFILALIIFIAYDGSDGTCDRVEKVNFREIHFQFPMKVRDALKTPMSGFSRYHTKLQTDSIGGKNIAGKWFFEWEYGLSRPEEITDTVREQLIYGVAFELLQDSCKTDQEIVEEIRKMYPGSYKYSEENGLPYYVWERDCLTIFVKRVYPDYKGYSVPEVSFCYGLSEPQAKIYGYYTGYINNYPD